MPSGLMLPRDHWTNYKGSSYSYNPPETVGSIASFSSHGPRVDAGAPPKPEIVAPGSAIISARDPFYARGSTNYDPFIIPNNSRYSNNVGQEDYYVMAGTSMASPLAAGVATLLLQKNITLTPEQIKFILEESASDKGVPGYDTTYGWGLINADAACKNIKTLNSFMDSAHTITASNFDLSVAHNTVYLYGTGYPLNHPYQIVYYDGSNNKVLIDNVSSNSNGAISSQHTFVSGTDVLGSWHVIVCESQAVPSAIYNAAWPYTIMTNTFTLSQSTTQFLLTVAVNGSGNTNPPVGLNSYVAGTVVNVYVVPAGGWQFSHWNGDTNNYNAASTTVKVDANKTVIANFFQNIDMPHEIAFMSERDGSDQIYVMNDDGSGQTRLTQSSANNSQPAWSPDGTKIAYVSNNGIYIMNADGSNSPYLINPNGWQPAWSPDGTKIAYCANYQRNGIGTSEIYVMNVDGANITRLTNNACSYPAWSPDGKKIAFTSYGTNPGIYTMNSDGSNIFQLGGYGSSPKWSPDGTKIAYTWNDVIWVINADGKNNTQITSASGGDYAPFWSPDGKRIVFCSGRKGNIQIGIMNQDGSNLKILTDSIHNDNPVWRPCVPTKPAVITGPDTGMNGFTATINGTLSKLGNIDHVSLSFDWGTDTNYTGGNAAAVPASLSTPGTFTANLTGLTSGQTYHYRVRALGDGIAYGNDNTFTLDSGKLAVTTGPQTITAGTASAMITVQTQNESGNPFNIKAPITINLGSSSANGKFDTSASGPFNGTITSIPITIGNHSASFYYKDITAGTPTITVSSTSYISASQQETIQAAAASQIRVETSASGNGTVVPAQNVAAGKLLTVYAITRDQYGNFVSNAPGTWSLVNQTGGIVAYLMLFPDNKGAVFEGDRLGSANIHVETTGLTSVDSGLITVVPKFTITGYTSPTIAGTANNFTVTAQDNLGNVSYTGTVHFTSSDPQAVLPADYPFVSGDNGTHTFTATLKTATNQSITATDTTIAAITGSQSNINITPASKSKLIWGTQPPATVTAGATWPAFTIKIADQYGNQTADTDSVTIAPSSGTLGGTLSNTSVSGLATFKDINRTLAGNLTLSVTSGTLMQAPASNTITVNPAAASQVGVESAADGSGSLVPDQNVAIGSSLTVYGITRDQYGNYTGSPTNAAWSLTAKTGSVADTDLTASGDGKSAVFTGHQAGTAVINASVTGLTSIGSGTITVPAPVISYPSGGGGGGDILHL